MRIIAAHAPAHLNTVRELFREYADSLELDLCFQDFERELAELPGKYAPPSGRLFLAVRQERPAGCAAVRAMDKQTCEMKRLYVRPEFRRFGAGRLLARATIDSAREIGYQRMRLDTLASMTPAIALYESLGFGRIEPYYHNPSPAAVFMELVLA
jgi:ribosomal protein S18 acetylase RimI-like enzyme